MIESEIVDCSSLQKAKYRTVVVPAVVGSVISNDVDEALTGLVAPCIAPFVISKL